MGTHMITPPQAEYVDPRRNLAGSEAELNSHNAFGPTIFTANDDGTTTTIIGADAVVGDNANVVRIGEKFVLKTAAGARKEETVFEITDFSTDATSTTVTFTPAAAVATANTDEIQLVSNAPLTDNDTLDARLTAISGTTYSQANLDRMTLNDKIYALRVQDDPTGF